MVRPLVRQVEAVALPESDVVPGHVPQTCRPRHSVGDGARTASWPGRCHRTRAQTRTNIVTVAGKHSDRRGTNTVTDVEQTKWQAQHKYSEASGTGQAWANAVSDDTK